MVTVQVSSPCRDTTLPEIASTGTVPPVAGSRRASSPRECSDWLVERVEVEEGETGAVAPRPARGLGAPPVRAGGEQPLGRRVHQQELAGGVGDQDGVEHRVED